VTVDDDGAYGLDVAEEMTVTIKAGLKGRRRWEMPAAQGAALEREREIERGGGD
jgi:hypothetical protein